MVQKFRYLTEWFRYMTDWFRYMTEWFRYVTDKIISTALVITSSRETTSGRWPHLIQGQRWICVRPGLGLGFGRGILSRNKHFRTTRSNTNHSVKYQPLGQIPGFSNHSVKSQKPLGQILLPVVTLTLTLTLRQYVRTTVL